MGFNLDDLARLIGGRIEVKDDGSPPIVRGIGQIEQFSMFVTNLAYETIFRGQRCDWPLVPAVGRSGRLLQEEQNVFEEFKREALPHLRFMPANCWQWLAVAQHNRLPTRFLDWSKSALVALWFAVENTACEKEESAIVWAYTHIPSEVRSSSASSIGSPFSIEGTFVYYPEHVFPYIQAQSGVFTIHHKHEGRFVPLEEQRDDRLLIKIEIPSANLWAIKHDLYRLGIHDATLFPGLSGLVNRIKYQNDFSDISSKSRSFFPGSC